MIIRRNKKNRKIKNRKKETWLAVVRKTVFGLVLISFLAVSFWTIFFSEVMKVSEVVSEGESLNFPSPHVKEHVGELIQGELLGFLPKDNLLLISTKKIARELESSHELIRNVSVKKKFPSTLVVEIEERESHIVWCNNESCVLLDERGEAFGENKEFEGKNLVKVMDSSNKPFKLGDRIVEPKFVFFSEKLPEIISRELSVEIDPVLQTPSSMSDEIRATTGDGWQMMFSTERPMEIQTKVMRKIIQEKVKPENVSLLEYVDLRIKGKATYKLKESDDENENENENSKDKEDE